MTRPLSVAAEASASFIREQSERQIRAHAHRLVAGRRDAIRTMDGDERREELLSLAEKVAARELHAEELAAASLPYLSDVSNAAYGFELLVAAVVVRRRFVADPDGWLVGEGLSTATPVWESMEASTLAAVDGALDELCGVSR